MAHLVKKAFQLTPNQLVYQQKRYRGKINIRKPKIFYKKAVMNELLTPFFINKYEDKTLDQFCSETTNTKSEEPLQPYDRILSREARNWFDNSKMIGCLHLNSISELEKFDTRVLLHKQNMHYKQYGEHIVRAAIKNSPHEKLGPLICKNTGFVFSSEINVSALRKIIKKNKKMFLLAGVLEGQVMKIDEFLRFGDMDITAAQLRLVQILQSAGGVNLTQQLTHHQSTLVSRLKQIGTNETTSDDKQ